MNSYEKKLTPSLSGKLWLLAALFLVLLPHLLRLPIGLSLACIGVFGWRLAHELKGWALPRRALRWAITLIAFAAVAALFKTVVGRDGGVALLSIMLCLKLLELRTLRDAMVTLYLGYFLVIGAFLFSQSIYTGVYLLIVVLMLTTALIVLNHPQATPAHTRHYLRYSGQLLLQAFPIMVVMFLLFPRLDGPLWSMPQGASGKTGLSDTIRMGTISSLVESQEVAFRVEFNGPIPPADQLYWRGPVLWHTDGRLWQRMPYLPQWRRIPVFEQRETPVEYTVTLEGSGYNWLFALDLPTTMPEGMETPTYILEDFQLLSNQPITTKQRYTLHSALNYQNNTIRQAQKAAALSLPEDTNVRTLALAQNWVAEGESKPRIVERALNYFRDNDFYYSRQPPLLDVDPVDDFLFKTRRGFCEHYATSFVTLMRAAGIPARVVTGYQGGESNHLGNYLIVRQSNAHAWAEVWLETEGWRRIDPTANIPIDRVEEAVDTQRFATTDLLASVAQGKRFTFFTRSFFQLRQMWDAVNHGWNQWVLGFDREQQDKLLRALGIKDMSWQNLLTILVAAIALLVLAVSAIVLLKRPRQQNPVQRHYQRFCDKLAKQGTVRAINEGPQDFAQRACRELPHLCEQITEITRRYIELRYQQQKEAKDLRGLRQAVQQFG
jgi:transglutaminase-like putative cysteine protease